MPTLVYTQHDCLALQCILAIVCFHWAVQSMLPHPDVSTVENNISADPDRIFSQSLTEGRG
jgi:hypothetical protein